MPKTGVVERCSCCCGLCFDDDDDDGGIKVVGDLDDLRVKRM
jgi:hypothetical protein